MIVTIPKEPIDESLLPTLTFYHGSIHKLDKILPTAFDVGNKFRDARWSVFMFRKKEYAKYYAMSFMIEQTIKSLKRKQSEFPPTMGWLEKTGINSYEFRGVAMDKNYDEIKELCLGKKYYVYTLEVPLSTSLDVIGTNPTLPEYTYGGIPKTVKRDEYTITEKDFDKLHKRVSKEEYDKIAKEKPFRKPIVSQAFRAFQLDDDTRSKNRRVAIILTRQGDLKPGDDLKFLEDSSIYYRVTYKGEGIYQAVKKAVSKDKWEELLKDPALTWLPKPPKYEKGYESYFTKDGFSKFFTTTRRIFRNILDEKYIKLSKAKIDNKDIVYKDKYQVVANRNVVKEETDMLITESRLSNGLYTDDYDKNIYYLKNRVHSPKDLNNIMNGFRYGYFTKEGKAYVNPSDFSKYTTMEPHDTIRLCLGVCWDFAETEAYLFDKLFGGKYKVTNSSLKNGNYSLYYMEHEDTKGICPTHTWLAYMENNKVYLFESSWLRHQGIKEFDSEMEMINYYNKAQHEFMKSKGEKLKGGIFIKYLPVRRYGLSPLEFMNHVRRCNTSRLIKITRGSSITSRLKFMTMGESTSITSNEITSSKLPYKCEVRMCHQNYNNGNPIPSAKPTPQLILHKDGKNWRVRAEMLLFKEGKLYLVKQNKVNQYGVTYKLPGGGIDDPQEGIEETASRECREEALIIPTNVVYTGVEVQHIYDKIPEWHKAILHPEGIYYDGSMTFICTGEYKQEYKSYVKKMDQQDEMTKGHFYTYEQVEGILSKEHKALFKKYLKDYRRLQFMKEEFIPEIDRSFLDMDIPDHMLDDTPALEEVLELFDSFEALNESAMGEFKLDIPWKTLNNKNEIFNVVDLAKECRSVEDFKNLLNLNKVKYLASSNNKGNFFLWPYLVMINRACNCSEIAVLSMEIARLNRRMFGIGNINVSLAGDLFHQYKNLYQDFSHMYTLLEMDGSFYLLDYYNKFILTPLGNSAPKARYLMKDRYAKLYVDDFNKRFDQKIGLKDVVVFESISRISDLNKIITMMAEGNRITHDEFDLSLDSFKTVRNNFIMYHYGNIRSSSDTKNLYNPIDKYSFFVKGIVKR